MIKANGIKKYYGSDNNAIRAVDDVSFEIGKGDFAVITGHSGSGKSTLLNLIGGMTWPDEGELTVAGQNMLNMSDVKVSHFRAHTIGFIFQFQSMISTLNVIENVKLPLMFTDEKNGNDTAQRLLEKVGLKDRAHAYVHELSAGQQRRVGIARALINSPDLLLCDEPTGDLDTETETIIMDMIANANKNGTTVFMTTHNLALRSYATKTFTIKNGWVIQD